MWIRLKFALDWMDLSSNPVQSNPIRSLTRPFKILTLDTIEVAHQTYNGHRYILHAYCIYSKWNRVVTLPRKNKETLVPAIKSIKAEIRRKFNATVAFLWVDDELGYGYIGDNIRTWCL